MKYFNEKNGKYYDTAEECEKVEQELALQEEEKSKTKKACADAIDEAEKKVLDAYKHYDDVRNEATKIVQEAREKANDLLKEAEKQIRETEKERREKLLEFNEKFGPYKKVYTTDKVDDEVIKLFDNWLNFPKWLW